MNHEYVFPLTRSRPFKNAGARRLRVLNTYKEFTTALFFPRREHQETLGTPFGRYNLENAPEQRHCRANISASRARSFVSLLRLPNAKRLFWSLKENRLQLGGQRFVIISQSFRETRPSIVFFTHSNSTAKPIRLLTKCMRNLEILSARSLTYGLTNRTRCSCLPKR
jgi:hypothetical protein